MRDLKSEIEKDLSVGPATAAELAARFRQSVEAVRDVLGELCGAAIAVDRVDANLGVTYRLRPVATRLAANEMKEAA